MSKRRRAEQRREHHHPSPSGTVPAKPGEFKLSASLNPLPEGVSDQKVEITAVLQKTDVDWGQKALEAIYHDLRGEPPETFPSNSCRVAVRTAVQPISFMKVGGFQRFSDGRYIHEDGSKELVTVSAPNRTFIRRFSENEPRLRLDKMFSTVERVRNYLAFSAGFAIPIVAVLTSRGLLFPLRVECPMDRYLPSKDIHKSEEARSTWCDQFATAYESTSSLMDAVAPEIPLGRAISLVGESIWTTDSEESFFYAWRALEVVATADLAEARRRVQVGDAGSASLYLNRLSEPILNEQLTRLDPEVKVAASVQKRVSPEAASKIERFYNLRNAIAHGTVSPSEHLEIMQAVPEIQGVSRNVVESLLREFAVARSP